MGIDRSLTSIFVGCFGILLHESTTLAATEYFPYLFFLQKSFMRLPCKELEVS